MARNYAAERERRWALELERAASEGRTPDRARARGHISKEVENERRRNASPEDKQRRNEVRRLNYWRKRTAYGIPYPEWSGIVESSVERVGRARTIELLKAKDRNTRDFMRRVDAGLTYTQAAQGSAGKRDYERFMKRESFLPRELFFYHGGR